MKATQAGCEGDASSKEADDIPTGRKVARNSPKGHALQHMKLSQRIGAMPRDLSRKEEQRGTRNVMMWGVIIAAAILVALLAIFILLPARQETSPVKNLGEQNSGVNAPLETQPPAGTHEDGYGNTKLPEGQQ
jgi:hypothetical protein